MDLGGQKVHITDGRWRSQVYIGDLWIVVDREADIHGGNQCLLWNEETECSTQVVVTCIQLVNQERLV